MPPSRDNNRRAMIFIPPRRDSLRDPVNADELEGWTTVDNRSEPSPLSAGDPDLLFTVRSSRRGNERARLKIRKGGRLV